MAEYDYVRHQRALTAFASTITRDWEDARDVVQDVFAECLARDIRPDRGYLFRSVRNRALNMLRSRQRLERMLEQLHDLMHALGRAILPADDAGVIETVLGLPSHYKEVLILRIHAGLTIAEVASILGIPEGTVKSRLNAALKILRKILEETSHD